MRATTTILLSLSLACSACDAGSARALRGVQVPAARLTAADALERGRTAFLTHCALCHGTRADGRGVRRADLIGTPADFTRAAWRARAEPARVFATIRTGVPRTSMPPWGALEDDEVWDIVAYLLSVAGGGS